MAPANLQNVIALRETSAVETLSACGHCCTAPDSRLNTPKPLSFPRRWESSFSADEASAAALAVAGDSRLRGKDSIGGGSGAMQQCPQGERVFVPFLPY